MTSTSPARSEVGGLHRRTVAGYAIGSLGTGGFSTLPGLVLVYYLTDTLAVPALAAGILVGAAKIWDVLIDPVIGGSSDRDLLRTGSRRRGMILGAIALPFLFALTFAVPDGFSPTASGVWVLVAFVLTATAFSLFQVPYIALPAELADGYDQRTRLLTWRVVVLTFAILLFGAGGPALRSLGADERQGYLLMAVIAGVVLAVGMLLSIAVVPRTGRRAAPAVDRSARRALIIEGYRAGLGALRRSQPFRALLLTFALQALATGMMLAGAQYVATWVLRSEDAVTFLFLALIAPALVFTPVWGVVARRIGKERGFAIASVIFGIAALSLLGLAWAPGDWAYLPVAVAGAAYAGMQSLPMAMLPDVISSDATAHGNGSAGAFGGVWTAGETTGAALGATVLTLGLAASGYVESAAGQNVVQSPGAILGIVVTFSVVPAVLIAVSLLALRRYRVRRADIDQAAIPVAEGIG
ncbi:MFS transporter [Naasia lichenicola]|uniref:MFS transporter n=1 Tax=Naasia lichenicola TaxID=2565933 RepID=A0A4S4FFR1_9MICO|nr:MFS transporter [Naasia lichenicola]THG28484.1 MFS transporter [Naasia lichenicola]